MPHDSAVLSLTNPQISAPMQQIEAKFSHENMIEQFIEDLEVKNTHNILVEYRTSMVIRSVIKEQTGEQPANVIKAAKNSDAHKVDTTREAVNEVSTIKKINKASAVIS